jgi:flagellar hook-associated protein 1 FlgK
MSLTSALQTSVSSLRVNTKEIDLISRNIANVSTAGYTKKSLPREALVFGEQGVGGITSGRVTRFVSEDLSRQLRFQNSLTSKANIETDYLSRLETLYGKPSDDTSFSALLGQIKDSFLQLQQDPNSITYQQQVIQKADRFAQNLNTATDFTQELRRQAEVEIGESVKTINGLTTDISDLNKQISVLDGQNLEIADLQDKRDQKINDLSKLIDISYFIRSSDNAAIVSLSDGRTLVEDKAYQFSFTPGNITTNTYYDTNPTINGGLTGLKLNNEDVLATGSIQGGKLGGLFSLRDQKLPQAQAQMDELAANLMAAFGQLTDPQGNSIGYDLFDDQGDVVAGYPSATSSDYGAARAAAAPINDFDFVSVGLNVDQEVGLAGRIRVSEDFKANPWRTREGSDWAAQGNPDAFGDPQFLPFDNERINAVSDQVFSQRIAFRTNNVGQGNNLDLRLDSSARVEDYSNQIIAFQATQLDDLKTSSDKEQSIADSVEASLYGQSGVNTDQELARLLEIQANYTASGKVIQSLQRLFDDLFQIV